MQFDYLQGQILGVSANASEIVIRLDPDESEVGAAPEIPVLNMRLKDCPRSQSVYPVLTQHIFDWAEIFFQEAGGKYLEISFDYSADADLRLDYARCEITKEPYTIGDLTEI